MHVRLVLVAAAGLSFANGLLILLSCLLGARTMAIAISVIVALLLAGVGVLLLGLSRHHARAAALARRIGDEPLTAALSALGRHLAVAGVAAGLSMLLVMVMILHRMSEGFAVFG